MSPSCPKCAQRIARVLLPLGEGGPKGRMRADLCPHPPLRGTLSQRERDLAKNSFRFLRTLLLVVFAMASTAVLAQQDKSPQDHNQQQQDQPKAAQPQTEAAQTQTEEAQTQTGEGGKLISVPGGKALGMSILGNQEAPKALVIVPWKRSELGNVQGISTMLDDSRQPIDKEVFMRMLSYYEIRSGTARPGSAPNERNAAQPAAAAQRRKQ
jgi:hypothetical protein